MGTQELWTQYVVDTYNSTSKTPFALFGVYGLRPWEKTDKLVHLALDRGQTWQTSLGLQNELQRYMNWYMNI